MDMSSLSRLSSLLTRPVSTVLDATAALVSLPRRVVTMVIEAEQTLSAVNAATERTDALIDRINGITTKAEGAVRAAYETVGAAAAAIEQASNITATAAPLLASYSEPLRRLEPAVHRLAESTDTQEVDALVKLIDRLPRLVNVMDDDRCRYWTVSTRVARTSTNCWTAFLISTGWPTAFLRSSAVARECP